LTFFAIFAIFSRSSILTIPPVFAVFAVLASEAGRTWREFDFTNFAINPRNTGGLTHTLQRVFLKSSSARFVSLKLGVEFAVGSLQLADDSHERHDLMKGNDRADRTCRRRRRVRNRWASSYFCFQPRQ
jgi:hypothetical protein